MRLAAKSLRFRWLAASVAAGAAVVLFFSVNPATPYVSTLDIRLQDRLLVLTTRENLPENFVLVGLDDASMAVDTLEPEEVASSKALQHMKKGFPFSREVYAIAGQKLLDAGAKLVIFDFIYPGPNPGDAAFAEFMKKNPGRFVVGGLFDKDTYRKPTAVLNAAAGDSVGFANLPKQTVIRYAYGYGTISLFESRPPMAGERIEPSLAAVAARLLGRPLRPETPNLLRFRYSKPGQMKPVSLQELFIPAFWKSKNRNWEMFRNKVVLIGPTAEGLKDFHLTPFGRMSGPEIQLQILAATLRGSWLGSSGPWFAIGSIFVAAAGVFALAIVRRNPIWFHIWLVAVALAWLGICVGALVLFSWFLPVAPPLATWLVCGFLVLTCDATLEGREKARMRKALERYVSKDMVKEIAENPQSYLQMLGGERKEIVTLFSDLKGFTADAESMDPSEMVKLLNDYFGEMVAIVFQKRGNLDKFMGDALMATWGPFNSEGPRGDARNALRAAFEMRQRLAVINARREGMSPWHAGIGITHGSVVFGNIGCEEKMDITAIGDSVNLASRLEGLTRTYGCEILVDDSMAENLRGECQLLPVDTVRVKGRLRAETIYFPYPGHDPGAWAEAFVAARADYRDGKFAEAEAVFARLAEDGLAPALAKLYRERCAEFQKNPPPANWGGVWDFSTK